MMQTSRPLQALRPLQPKGSYICAYCTRRSFFSFPSVVPASGQQHLSASRTIRAPPALVYSIISDVGSYSSFLPFCKASNVTKTSSPTELDGKVYPEEAQLVIGFKDYINETFWSRVYCVPGKIVEAVSGGTETSLRGTQIAHHSPRPPKNKDIVRESTILSHLLTRWTILGEDSTTKPNTERRPDETAVTKVQLNIEYEFASPIYSALSQAAAPKVAEKMIEAFEKRVLAKMEESERVRK